MMKRIFALLALLLGLSAQAQNDTDVAAPAANAGTNAEVADELVPPPPPRWESTVGMGFTLTSGNSETVLLTGMFSTKKKRARDEWSFGADGAFGQSSGVTDNEMAHGFGQYNHLLDGRYYAYARVDALYDGIADIDYRFNLTPGLGWYVIKTSRTTLSLEAGPGYVFEKKGGVANDYPTVRVAQNFEYKLNGGARIWESVSYLPDLGNFSNYQVNAEIGIEAPLVKKLALGIVASDNYNSQPAAGKEPNDLRIVSRISYKF